MKDSNIKEDMNKNGYVILKNILSQDMVKSYHKLIGDYFGINGSGGGKSMWKPDSFNDPGLFDLHKLFSVDNFINPLQELTDNKLMYLHHGDIHLNFTAINLHEDVQERGTDNSNYSWQEGHVNNKEPFRCYTIAMYLQDHQDNSGLSVMEGSHKLSYTDMPREEMYKLNIPLTELHTNSGDVVVFDCRLLHKGNIDSRGDRRAIYFRMGQDNIHSRNHIHGAVTRQQQENKKAFDEYQVHSKFKEVLEANSILY